MLTAMRRNNVNGVYEIHTNAMHFPASLQPTHARIEQVIDNEPEESSGPTSFPPLNPAISRNFLVTDVYMETPPAGISLASYDMPFRQCRPDRESYAQADFLAPFQGLSAVPQEIRDLLPDDCREAFDKAATREHEWHSKWGGEATSTSRREPVVDKAIVPYSMLV
jgi:chromatin structure-remodeling complex protein RSC7